MKYKYTIGQIESVTGKKIEKLHIIGGGANNEMMNQLTADAIGIPVYAGPTEATAIGNLLIQARAMGVIDTLEEIRQVVRDSFDLKIYQPNPTLDWDSAYMKFKMLE